MKGHFIVLCIFLTFASGAFAQKLTKEEKKAQKAEAKALKKEVKAFQKNLDSFKAFKEAKANAESENVKMKAELKRVKDLEAQCATEVEELRAEIEQLMAKLEACNNKPSDGGFSIPKQGLVYVVQIGAFQEKDVAVNDGNPDLRKESADGFNKYIMGAFPDIQQADQLRAFLLQLDFRTNPEYRPFIAPYKDGQRVTLDEALGPEEAEKRRQQMEQLGQY